MKIYISEEDILRNIQHRFSEAYNNLRLEFFKHAHSEGAGSSANEKLSPALPLEEVRMFHNHGWIDISPGRTVADVEADFSKKLGLHVQVMRRSGQLWLETTKTDNRTLEEQNRQGGTGPLMTEKEEKDFDLEDIE